MDLKLIEQDSDANRQIAGDALPTSKLFSILSSDDKPAPSITKGFKFFSLLLIFKRNHATFKPGFF